MPKFNPYRPGSIVAPGMFVGRGREILALERILFQTENDNPHHFVVQGERGIGNSSLFLALDHIARGDWARYEGDNFAVLTIGVELDPSNEYADIIKKVGSQLRRVVSSHERLQELAKGVWDFLKRWEVMGVKYRAPEGTSEPAPHELLEDLSRPSSRSCRRRGGNETASSSLSTKQISQPHRLTSASSASCLQSA